MHWSKIHCINQKPGILNQEIGMVQEHASEFNIRRIQEIDASGAIHTEIFSLA